MSSIVFFGTPEPARVILDHILHDPTLSVRAVVSQPDRPVGRHQILTPSPVRALAIEHGIPTHTPERLRKNTDFFDVLRSYEADWFIVVAYGRILPAEILTMPHHMCVNTHFSILPEWRGASPIQASLLAGDAETGVAIMEMSLGMDEGDILALRHEPIRTDDTTPSLTARLAHMSWPLLIETLRAWEAWQWIRTSQDAAHATYCSRIEKEHGTIDWSLGARDIYRRWQAYTPWPSISTTYEGKRCIIEDCSWCGGDPTEPVGTIVRQSDKSIAVATGSWYLVLHRVKIEGGKSQDIETCVRGRSGMIGTRLPS